ncbi:MAG: FecR domain-containing protein [Candidatus Symbiothrix sp.]|jgi:ferric-dicitrate binding protein FerR (iron transport regulator)|nr:FecR domain-containing protein [Candidatus Symbiothrix sp.]
MDKEAIYRFFNGTSSPDEEARLQEWLEESDDNHRIWLNERKLFDMSIMNVDDSIPEKRKHLLPVLKNLLKIAAIVVITLCISYFIFNRESDETAQQATQTITVPAGQRVNLTLPDGTNVWLNARTSISYPVVFGRKERMMKLDGEAYFEVAKDKDRPFTVITKDGEIEVTGTSFNVQAYSLESVFETTLMEGNVCVRLSDGAASEVRLLPGQKASLSAGKLRVEKVEDFTHYRWREGLICFSNNTFVEIMHDLERYYDVKIKVLNQKVLKRHYTGKFRYTDGVDYALRALQKNIPFEIVRDDENQIIEIK